MGTTRGIGLVLAALTLLAGATAATAQGWPAKPVRLVVPFPPGGPADMLGRLLAEKYAAAWGQSVVIENRGGAAGNIGAEVVARAAPDGYTFLLNASGQVINASLYPKLAYDPIRDFSPVSEVASYMLVVVVHPSLPAKTLREFVTIARARPGEIVVANAGSGTPTHLAAELFQIAAGIRCVQVPYKGAAPANTDLLGGHAQVMFNNPVNALPMAKSGRLRALAVTGAKRLSIAPELPTIAESGYPGFEAGTWYALLGPAGVPREIVERVHAETVKALRAPDVREKLAAQGWDTSGSTPAELAALLKSDLEKWGTVIRRAGIKAE